MKEVIGVHYRMGETIRLKVAHGKIVAHEVLIEGEQRDLPYLAPGFVDLQINGYGGYDFNSLPLDENRFVDVTQKLWKEGVTSYLPTVITNSDEAIEQVLRKIAEVCNKNPEVERTIAGIHLEGPFISPEDGPRGAHHREYVKAPDWDLFQRWQEAADGRIRIITLSPEWSGAVDFIRKCTEKSVIVSIGHTSATDKQIRAAVAAGARMSTHLGNGAHLMLPRHPNYLWEQLAEDQLWACMIADGFHLPDAVLKVILRVKGEGVMLVSDAVSFSGMEPGTYSTYIGGKVVLTSEGKLHLADNPQLLAGSVQMLKWGVDHMVNQGLSTLAEAWEMASIRPAAFLGLPQQGGLEAGAPADVILFTREAQSINIIQTLKNGEPVYENKPREGGDAR